MSYCRWSCMDYQCDVYCYESDSGYEVHIASRRPVRSPQPKLPDITKTDAKEYNKLYRAYMDDLEIIEKRKIGHPMDGEHFTVDTAQECAQLLKEIKGIGYNVPDYAIDALEEEAKEGSSE